MERILGLCFILCFVQSVSCQQKKNYKIHTVGFYNLENLFDTIDDPNSKDEYSPILQIQENKSSVYWKKVDNMAKVLSEIGRETATTSASILGIAEVENEQVIQDLLATPYFKDLPYDYVHSESEDWRGIDVGLIYNKTLFSLTNFTSHNLIAWNSDGYRVRTRSQLVVSGYLDNELMYIIVNHWPSQREGKRKTEYLRKKSAELTLSIIDSIQSETPNPKLMILGDFNDNPNAKSLKMLTAKQHSGTNIDNIQMYNPFESMHKKGLGTLGYRDQLNLFDQIMVSSTMNTKTYENYQLYKAGIFNPNYLITKSGKYKGYPKRSFSNNKFTGGYSDHYPIYIYLIKSE